MERAAASSPAPARRRCAELSLAAALGLALLAAPAAAQTTARSCPLIGPGFEVQALHLLGPYAESGLPGGFVLGDTRIEARAIRYRFHRAEQSFELVLQHPSAATAVRSARFGIGLADPDQVLAPAESASVLALLAATIRERDQAPGPWRDGPCEDTPHAVYAAGSPLDRPDGALHALRESGMVWFGRGVTLPGHASLWPLPPTLLCQVLLLAGLLALVPCGGSLRRLAGRVSGRDWRFLAVCSGVGLGLRLLGGVRVPGHINGHGYELVRHLLFAPLAGMEFHGNGSFALHGLTLALLPRCERSIVAVQLLCSLLCIPACYALARLWLGRASLARWAAALAAVLPVTVFYAATEERLVPGVLFLLVTLVLLAAAARQRRPLLLLPAALLGAVTVQFQPFLLLLPLPALLLLSSTPAGRPLLRRPWFWLAAAGLGLLMLDSAIQALRHIADGTGPAGMVAGMLRDAYQVLLPTLVGTRASASNVFLNPTYTPWPLGLLALLGVIAAWRDRERRWPVLAILACALAFTAPAMVAARMNSARLQLAALPFYLLLAAYGLDRVLRRAARHRPAWRGRIDALAAAALAATIALWPGPTGMRFTPQLERAVIARAIPVLPLDSVVFWPAVFHQGAVAVPSYLSEQQDLPLYWGAVPDGPIPPPLSTMRAVYLRPAACYDRNIEPRVPAAPDGPALRPECARIEAQLALAPLHVETVAAVPDNQQEFTRERLEIGVFEIRR